MVIGPTPGRIASPVIASAYPEAVCYDPVQVTELPEQKTTIVY